MKKQIDSNIKAIAKDLIKIRDDLFNKPEVGLQEFESSQLIIEQLKKFGFIVENNYCGLPTAFKAIYDSGIEGSTIAFICEYDGLPDIGHGCGHNVIAAMGVGAGYGLKSVIDQVGGKVFVFGTPDEESTSGKITLVKNNAFDDVDAVIMAHPASFSEESGVTLALSGIRIEFFGSSTHAAQPKEYCKNALDALVMTYLNINNMKQYIPDANIYGIVENGGVRPNIIPDYTSMLYYVRSQSKEKLEEYLERLRICCEHTSKSIGVEVKITEIEERVDNLVTNQIMNELFIRNYQETETNYKMRKSDGYSATSDIGNVSHVVPTIHPWLCIYHDDIQLHTKEFADATMTKEATEAMINGAIVLAKTGFDILDSPNVLEKIKKEFDH